MNHYRIRLRGQTYDVRVLSDPAAPEVQVEIDGEPLTVTVETVPESHSGGEAAADEPGIRQPPPGEKQAVQAPPSNVVASPLPGVIKSVAVRPGEHVSPGQLLLVIEAMKMDNLLRASRAGVVREVYVTPGSQVAHGEPLLAYEAP